MSSFAQGAGAAWAPSHGVGQSSREGPRAHSALGSSNLETRINAAAEDDILHETRRKRAHEDIRALGNDVLHDEWREVTAEEVEVAHHYAQRILEDFYDDRSVVEATLKTKKRLPLPDPATRR